MQGKVKVTVEFEMSMDTDHYEGCDTLEKAAALQLEYFKDGTASVIESAEFAEKLDIRLEVLPQ